MLRIAVGEPYPGLVFLAGILKYAYPQVVFEIAVNTKNGSHASVIFGMSVTQCRTASLAKPPVNEFLCYNDNFIGELILESFLPSVVDLAQFQVDRVVRCRLGERHWNKLPLRASRGTLLLAESLLDEPSWGLRFYLVLSLSVATRRAFARSRSAPAMLSSNDAQSLAR
jgi:hypothetical protein